MQVYENFYTTGFIPR